MTRRRTWTEAEQIALAQKLLERKRRALAVREGIGGLTEADLPWDERTRSAWDAEKERIRREKLRAEKYR